MTSKKVSAGALLRYVAMSETALLNITGMAVIHIRNQNQASDNATVVVERN